MTQEALEHFTNGDPVSDKPKLTDEERLANLPE